MTKISRNQLRTLIRESIEEIESERNANLLRKRIQIRIIERKLAISKTLLESRRSGTSPVNLDEGIFDNVKGGLDSMLKTLGRAAFGGWAGRDGYDEYGGLSPQEIKDSRPAMLIKNAINSIKGVESSLKVLKNTKFDELIRSQGQALFNYVDSVLKAIYDSELLANETSIEEEQKEQISLQIDRLDSDASEVIAQMQEDLQTAQIALQSGSSENAWKQASS